MSEVIANRYELEELVGKGGMSSVYRATDRLLERKVALKILHDQFTKDEDYVERFRREARAAAQLGHPNIVTVIDRGEHGGRQFIVFEYVDGDTLKQLIERTGPLPVRDALDVALQVAEALCFAHERGVIHRDVKPHNVLINGDGRPKVTDFGIARSLDVEGLTQTGAVVGTSDYIAPEQARGERVDAQTDVYSLGVVLYELLTGEVPFRADNFVAVAMRHVNDPPPSVLERRPDVPLRLVAAVDRALAKDPADRFGSMADFVSELHACREELGEDPESDMTLLVQRPVQASPPRARARSRRRLWPVPLAIALLAASGAGAIALWGALDDEEGLLPKPVKRQQPSRVVSVKGIAAYDPSPGDGSEHDSEVGNATDGDLTTFWTTETYYDQALGKPGVGLLLDAGRPTVLRKVTIFTDSPGFKARIRAGAAPGGRFTFRSGEETIGLPSTTLELRKGTAYRYYVVWITELSADRAHLNEVRART